MDPTDIQRGPQAAISLLSLWPLRVLLSLNSLPKRGQTIVPKKYSVTVWFDKFIYNKFKTIRQKWKSPQKRLVSSSKKITNFVVLQGSQGTDSGYHSGPANVPNRGGLDIDRFYGVSRDHVSTHETFVLAPPIAWQRRKNLKLSG